MALDTSDKCSASLDSFISELAEVMTAREIARYGAVMDALKFERPHPREPLRLQTRADEALVTWLAYVGRAAVSAVVEHAIAMHVAECLGEMDEQLLHPYALPTSLMQSGGCTEVIARHWTRGLQRFLSLTQGRIPDHARAEFEALVLALRPSDTYDDEALGQWVEDRMNQLDRSGTHDAPSPPRDDGKPPMARQANRSWTSRSASGPRTRARRLTRSRRFAASQRPFRWLSAPLADAGDGSGDAILTIPDGLVRQEHWRAGDVLHVVAPEGTLYLWKARKRRPLKPDATPRGRASPPGRHAARLRAAH